MLCHISDVGGGKIPPSKLQDILISIGAAGYCHINPTKSGGSYGGGANIYPSIPAAPFVAMGYNRYTIDGGDVRDLTAVTAITDSFSASKSCDVDNAGGTNPRKTITYKIFYQQEE